MPYTKEIKMHPESKEILKKQAAKNLALADCKLSLARECYWEGGFGEWRVLLDQAKNLQVNAANIIIHYGLDIREVDVLKMQFSGISLVD
jgi:hypothetical protein